MKQLIAWAVLWFCLWDDAGKAQQAPAPPVNPQRYVSPSGSWVCEVDPSDLYGRGEGNYTTIQSGSTVWRGKQPFTLYEAGVTDEGLIAGYAYTHGLEGFSKVGRDAGEGEFRIVIMRSTGELLLNEALKRKSSRFLHTSPDPLGRGLIVDGPNDRLIVRVRHTDVNRRGELWWIYGLSNGKPLGKIELVSEDRHVRAPIRAEPVAGTPLVLLHYWRYESPHKGARFALVDSALREVWRLDLPNDYDVPGNEAGEDRLRERIWATGAILNARSKNQFEIFRVATSERVMYRVRPAPTADGGWVVEEFGRAKHIETEAKPVGLPLFPNRPLAELGAFIFSGNKPGQPIPIHNVMSFDFDDRDRIGFVRQESENRYTFLLVTSDGKVLREVALAIADDSLEDSAPLTTWAGGERWLVAASNKSMGGKAAAWWVDVSNGGFHAISGFVSPPIWNLANSHDGGFVARTITRYKYSMQDEIIAFDTTGKIRWRLKQHSGGGEGELFSPEDVTVTTESRVAVVDNIRNTVQLFDREGGFLKVFKLQEVWGRKPNYPSGIAADRNGGFLVKDFNGNPPIVRMNRNGNMVSQFTLKYPDGRVLDATHGVKVSPSGRVWACDGDSLIRVTDQGVADRVLGQRPSDERLGGVAAVTVDQQGRLYAVDDRTGTVHVFDSTGARLRVCKPAVGDFKGKLILPALGVAPDGAVYLSDASSFPERQRFIRFAPNGDRIGIKQLGLDTISEQWHPLPSNGGLLVLGYHDAFLVNRQDKVTLTIQRRPDRNWLAHPDGASIAPDGSIAITTGGHSGRQTWQANLYNSTGEPIRTVSFPAECLNFCFAFTGKLLITSTETALCLFTSHGEPFSKFSPNMDGFGGTSWQCFATFGGKELWLVHRGRKTVHRFSLPE